MKRNRLLFLRLEGPLQGWGEHSKWDYRDTALCPTKSGIIGLLACALGLERGDPAIVTLHKQIRLAVRTDRAGRLLTDFHTVHADADRGERIVAASGAKRGDTIVTNRCYLQDASFLVAVSAPDSLIIQLDVALKNPRWPVYLGRKSCVPSVPVYAGLSTEYIDLDDAMRRYPAAKRSDEVRHYEVDSPDVSGFLRSDCLVDAARRSFQMRRVTIRHIQILTLDTKRSPLIILFSIRQYIFYVTH